MREGRLKDDYKSDIDDQNKLEARRRNKYMLRKK